METSSDSWFPKTIYLCAKDVEKLKEFSVSNWKKLNPTYQIEVYDNQRCEEFLTTHYSQKHCKLFQKIPDGPIKADFWRVCVLHAFGGVYVDADVVPIESLDTYVQKNVDFVTCSSYWDRMKFNFNPNFIVSSPKNSLLEKAIAYYFLLDETEQYSYWGWSIMRVFTDLLHLKDYAKEEGVYVEETSSDDRMEFRVQIIKEIKGRNHGDDHNVWQGKKIFNNRSENWDETTHQFK